MNKTSEAFEYFDRAKVLNETGVKNIVNEKVIPMIKKEAQKRNPTKIKKKSTPLALMKSNLNSQIDIDDFDSRLVVNYKKVGEIPYIELYDPGHEPN